MSLSRWKATKTWWTWFIWCPFSLPVLGYSGPKPTALCPQKVANMSARLVGHGRPGVNNPNPLFEGESLGEPNKYTPGKQKNINIPPYKKRKLSSNVPLRGDMLVPRRVTGNNESTKRDAKSYQWWCRQSGHPVEPSPFPMIFPMKWSCKLTK